MFGLVKFLTGFFLAIALLFVAGVASTRYLITKLATPPERPVFDNETGVVPLNAESTNPAAVGTASDTNDAGSTETAANNPPTPPPAQSTPEDQESAEDEAGYRAVVTQPIGLILRSDATQESRRITGLAYNTEVEILGESEDQEWLRVRLPGSGIEGWVKSGNTTPVP
jgi:uncharacterized protein YgiM (DUF1202 family)